MCTINDVANFFILQGRICGAEMSNLRVQKLCYYAQAWHLALKDKPLFSANFEAWVHGPVNPQLYKRFSRWKWRSVGGVIEEPNLSKVKLAFLERIWTNFSPFDAYQLELMTHQEEPWIEARCGLAPDENSNKVIKLETMKRFYRTLNEQAAT